MTASRQKAVGNVLCVVGVVLMALAIVFGAQFPFLFPLGLILLAGGAAGSVRMPLWASIAIIAAAVVLAGSYVLLFGRI